MAIERKELKSLVIDINKRVSKLNGEEMKGVSAVNINFEGGKWSLLITKDEIYEQAATE